MGLEPRLDHLGKRLGTRQILGQGWSKSPTRDYTDPKELWKREGGERTVPRLAAVQKLHWNLARLKLRHAPKFREGGNACQAGYHCLPTLQKPKQNKKQTLSLV